MADTIPYMGTKRELSAAVFRATATCSPGAIVDLFAGMGSVAAAHTAKRQVWANDIQEFAYLNNRCRLQYDAPSKALASPRMGSVFRSHLMELSRQSNGAFDADRDSSRAEDFASFLSARPGTPRDVGGFDEVYSCFVERYASTYFSTYQCGEIDSIRYGLEFLRGTGVIGQRDFDWGVLCLGAAALRCANTTGHFAQYLKPNQGNWRRVQRQARKSIWTTWESCVAELKPFGEPEWRKGNRVSRLDAVRALDGDTRGIGIVYCDPPYTDDQYSRFYHIWETVVLYDYPETSGVGRYRSGRFRTKFSLISSVASAFDELLGRVSMTGADLVLSYPSNGLLHQTGRSPLDMMGQYYPQIALFDEIDYAHSSMGGSSGSQKSAVLERIYVGRHATN